MKTDDQLITMTLKQPCSTGKSIPNENCAIPTPKSPGIKTQNNLPLSNQRPPLTLKWDTQNLKDERIRLSYQITLNAKIKSTFKSDQGSPSWDKLKECVQVAAASALNCPSSPMTPRRCKAIAKFEQLKFKVGRNPENAALKRDLAKARKEKYDANQIHIGNQCEDFFKNLDSHHLAEQVKNTFKFLKKFKRNLEQTKKKSFIPKSQWQDALRSSTLDKPVEPIPETDNIPLPNPPTSKDILDYLKKLKNNTAPGNDRINVELLKYGPPSLFQEIAKVITDAWESNIIPPEWIETTQIPIPKKQS